MQPATEQDARDALAALRAEIGVKAAAEVEAWDWAEDVALWFVLDEADDERMERGLTLREWFALDISERLGQQLQDMAKDLHPDERREGMKVARAGAKLAERLWAIAPETVQ